MFDLRKFLQGKKTYITMALVVAGAIATATGVAIPVEVFGILAALGVGSVGAKVDRFMKDAGA